MASVLVAAVLGILVPSAWAQTGGQITGTVTDAVTGSSIDRIDYHIELQLFTTDGTYLRSTWTSGAGYAFIRSSRRVVTWSWPRATTGIT